MKITSVTVVPLGSLPQHAARNTQRSKDVQTIIENLTKVRDGQALMISGTDIKKFERYALQKQLQKSGAKCVVLSGQHPETKKDALFVKRLSDAEWREYIKD